MKCRIKAAALGAAILALMSVMPVSGAESVGGKAAEMMNKMEKHPLTAQRCDEIVGRAIKDPQGQRLGKLDNLVVDLESARVLYAIVTYGGMLSSEKILVPPSVLTAESGGSNLVLNADKSSPTNAPRWTRAEMAQMGNVSFVNQIYEHFGQKPWWTGNTTPAGKDSFGVVEQARDLMGATVKASANTNLGKIKDLVVDIPNAWVLFAILSPKGDLGARGDLYPVPPATITKGPDRKDFVAEFDASKLQGAPHFNNDSWPNLADPAYAQQVYQYYGKQADFLTKMLTPTGR